ncbi:MAG TPA: MFS transporter [Solirubrobacteraceae bacterium]|nr:MFS transporter [Solirubrobacteraceae bacterium]
MLSRYESVVRVPGCARVFATALLARLPQGMSTLAILLLVRESTHSYPAAGAAVGGYALACAAAVPVQGRLVDRFGRGRVLFPVAVLQAVALALLVIVAHAGAPPVTLVALSTAAGAMQPAIAPSVRALLGEIVTDPTTRETAYALESVVQELIWITGPMIVALVITLLAPSGAVLVSAGVCVAGTTSFITSPRVRATSDGRSAHRARSAVRSHALRVMLGPVAMMGAAIGLIDVGIPALALHAGSRASTGVLLALWSLGSLCGGLWYGGISWRLPLSDRYRWLLTAAVACVVPLVFARTIPEGMVASLLAGVTIAPVFSCQYALVGRSVTSGAETEAFTWVAAALMAGLAGGSSLSGVLIGDIGLSAPFVAACAAMGVAALAAVRVRVTTRAVA